jgi:ABC-type lipoprotein export system ATPase subunit
MIATQQPAIEKGLSHRIRSIAVIGGFLDGAFFELTDGLNCFIGARGTGKTTALEFVRYALDSLPGREEQPAERRRIESLVERNLAGGRVEVVIETKDGLSYIISRSAGEEPLVLTADRQPTDITFKAGGVFRADIYSQNEVESIADRTTSQLSLLDNFEAERIAEVDSRLDHVRSALAANASQIVPLQSRIAGLTEELGTLSGVEERLKKFSAGTGQDAETINRAHSLKSLRDRENRIVGSTTQLLQSLAQDVSGLKGRVEREAVALADRDVAKGPNAAIAQEALDLATKCGAEIDQLLQSARERIAAALNGVAGIRTRLTALHKQQEMDFRALIEKHQQAQGQAAERAQLERRRNELLTKNRQRQQLADQLTTLETNRKNLLLRLSELWDERFSIREEVALRINTHLSPAIRVSVTQYGNPERYVRLLEDGLKSARVKHLIVAQKLANALWPADLAAAIRRRDAGLLMEKADLNSEQADKVVAALSNSPLLFDLETVELLDMPRIELRDGATYKDSLSLSTGQKCTAILPILLLDSDNPLLVDQPEDNLDNRFIFEAVVDSIRKVKTRRQMIFVTHNPNIPVLGDAERVFVLDSDGASARKANEGTVDQCKSDIVTLLEGGEDAFKARKCRYAY